MLIYLYLLLLWDLFFNEPIESSLLTKGEIYKNVVELNLFKDINDFRDLKIVGSPDETLEKFKSLNFYNLTRRDKRRALKAFIKEHFKNDTGLVHVVPADWKAWPDLVKKIREKSAVALAMKLNKGWMTSGRDLSPGVRSNPELYSLTLVPRPFFVGQDGARGLDARDGYWLFKGLLACGMYDSARDQLENLFALVKRYGYVPDRNRAYDTSPAPPLLAPMVLDYVKARWDEELLITQRPFLDEELIHWLIKKGAVLSNIATDYIVLLGDNRIPGRETYYRCVAPKDRPPVRLTHVFWSLDGYFSRPKSRLVSVEYCALAEWSARSLAALYTVTGYDAAGRLFLNLSRALKRTTRELLYSPDGGTWWDYDLENGPLDGGLGWVYPRWTGTSGARVDLARVAVAVDAVAGPGAVAVIATALRNTSLGRQIASRYLSRLPESVTMLESAVALHLLALFPDVTLDPKRPPEKPCHKYLIPFLIFPVCLIVLTLCASYKYQKIVVL